MATNSDIAYNIYKTIKEKQIKQIKQGTIKEADIIELSENDFINDLHETILFQTSSLQGFENLEKDMQIAIINSTYVNIFDSIEQVKDIKELISSDGMKIPNEIIKASIKSAVEKNENIINKVNIVEEAISVGIMAKLMQLETVEEKMNFFETLSEKEQKEVIYKLTENNFGKDVADRRREVDQEIEFFRDSELIKYMSEDSAKRVESKLRQKNPMIAIAKELGITSFDGTDVKKEAAIQVLLDAIRREFIDRKPNVQELIKYIGGIEQGYLTKEEIKALSQKIFASKEKNVGEFFEARGYESKKEERSIYETKIIQYKDIIVETLSKACPEIEGEIDEDSLIDIVRGVFNGGQIDFEMLITNCFLRYYKGKQSLDFNAYFKNVDILKYRLTQVREKMETENFPLDITDTDILIQYDKIVNETGEIDVTRLQPLESTNIDMLKGDMLFGFEEFSRLTFGEDMHVVGMEDFMREEKSQPLPEDVSAELNAIPVALQRINCPPEDVAKGMEAYKQVIGALTPEEIEGTPDMISEVLQKEVEELGLDGVAGDILKMMSQITFNGQISEILKNSKLEFLNMLETISLQGPLLAPRVFAVNPEQHSANSTGSAPTERIDEDTLKSGFAALAVDLRVAEQTIIRPEELVADGVDQRKEDQVEVGDTAEHEEKKDNTENNVIKKLQTFFGVYQSARISDSDLEEEISDLGLASEMLENMQATQNGQAVQPGNKPPVQPEKDENEFEQE